MRCGVLRKINCRGWSALWCWWTRPRIRAVSLLGLYVLFNCLIHPLLSVELYHFLLPLDEGCEGCVEHADLSTEPLGESIAEEFNESDIIVLALSLVLSVD